MDDVEAIWFGNGCEFARRVQAFVAKWRGYQGDPGPLLDELTAVLYADHNPLPGKLPELGDPPTLRPAVPPNSHPGRGLVVEPGS